MKRIKKSVVETWAKRNGFIFEKLSRTDDWRWRLSKGASWYCFQTLRQAYDFLIDLGGKETFVKTSITIPRSVRDTLVEEAQRQGVSFAEMVRRRIEESEDWNPPVVDGTTGGLPHFRRCVRTQDGLKWAESDDHAMTTQKI